MYNLRSNKIVAKRQSIFPMVNALFAFKLIEKEGSRKIEKNK